MDRRDADDVLGEFARYLDEFIVTPAARDIISAVELAAPPAQKHPWEMIGEYLREAAVLVLIFVPIDLLIPKDKPQSVSRLWLGLTLLVSLLMLLGGIWIERRER
jgi:hypothetical protein